MHTNKKKFFNQEQFQTNVYKHLYIASRVCNLKTRILNLFLINELHFIFIFKHKIVSIYISKENGLQTLVQWNHLTYKYKTN